MKKLYLVLASVVSVSLFWSVPASANELYPRLGYVSTIDKSSDSVAVDDGYNVWTFSGIDDWMVGDGVAMLMDDNGTPDSIYDDEIVSARYSSLTVSR